MSFKSLQRLDNMPHEIIQGTLMWMVSLTN